MQAWDFFLETIGPELGDEAIERWLRPLKVVHFDACNLYLEAESVFQMDWFEEHVRPLASRKFFNPNLRLIQIHLTCSHVVPIVKDKKKDPTPPPSFTIVKDPLFPEHTIDAFLFNEGNEILSELLSKLISSQKIPFSPLFLYGEQAAGKTHILQALALTLQKTECKALYVKTETFTENVVGAIRNGSMQEFRQAYRHIDILIIDDVHHLANKTATQEEFFHTFNALHTAGKQIILSSITAPSLLKGIEPRLTSRFEWGLALPLCKLTPDDLALIARRRSDELGLLLSEQALLSILESFSFNPASIQKALGALYLRAANDKRPLTPVIIKTLLQDLLAHEQKMILTPDKILSCVADFYGIPTKEILSRSQTQECAIPRQIAMFLCRQNLKMPFIQIGKYFHRDHSTVMTSVKAVEYKLTEGDLETKTSWIGINRKLENLISCKENEAFHN